MPLLLHLRPPQLASPPQKRLPNGAMRVYPTKVNVVSCNIVLSSLGIRQLLPYAVPRRPMSLLVHSWSRSAGLKQINSKTTKINQVCYKLTYYDIIYYIYTNIIYTHILCNVPSYTIIYYNLTHNIIRILVHFWPRSASSRSSRRPAPSSAARPPRRRVLQ